jgi:preprotein translocase subunit SecD
MKKIKQIIINPQNRQEIILQEDAAKDDVIDLNALHDINLDVSPINDFIEKFKDKALDERAKSIAEKEITIVRNRLQSEIDNINKTKENDIKVAIANTKEEYLQKYHEANNTIVKLESDLKSLSKDKDFEYRKLIEDKERSIEELKRENLNLRSKNK